MRRIALIVNSLQGGGAERVATHLANAWAGQGNAVTLLVTDSRRGAPSYPVLPDVTLVFLVDLGHAHRNGWRGYWAKFWALRNSISLGGFDVVVSFTTHVNIAVLLAAVGLKIRLLVSERTYPPLAPMGWGWAALRRFLYSRAARVVMQTQDGQRWLQEHIPAATGVVIPNPVQSPLTGAGQPLPPESIIDGQYRLLLAVGRLDGGKQFDHLILAFAGVARLHPEWKLAILGEGPERSRLEALIGQLGLQNDAFLPGRAGNISSWYQRASLFAMTSRFEGFPNALLEALAHGCPAVAYDCDTGPRDIIRNGVDGLLVAPVGDIAGFTQALQSLMQDEALRTSMAANAPAVRERFSMETVLHQWQQLFEDR